MNRSIATFALSLIASCLGAAAGADEGQRPVQNIYPLKFRDGHTEGGWVLAFDGGKVYEISFTDDSSHRAVEALGALDPEIIRLNTAPEHNIYLVGELKPVPGDDKAAGIPLASLRLDGWYIKAPFLTPPVSDPVDGPLGVCNELKPIHFLPAGEGPNSEKTKLIRALVRIHHDKRLNHFWLEAKSPTTKFLAKPDPAADLDAGGDSPAPK